MEFVHDPGQDIGDVELSYVEKAANQNHRGAQNYGKRQEYSPGTEDLALFETLRKLEKEDHPLRREKLQQQAEILAQGGVIKEQKAAAKRRHSKIQLSDPSEVNGSQSVMSQPYGQMQQKYGREEVQSHLAWAADNLSDNTIEVLNMSLKSQNIKDVEKAFNILQSMKANNITNLKRGQY